jgi:predicted ester cyclase
MPVVCTFKHVNLSGLLLNDLACIQGNANEGSLKQAFPCVAVKQASWMTTEMNKALVGRLWDEVWNKCNAAAACAMLPADYAAFELPWVANWHDAFPDFHVTVNEMIAEGDTVVSRITIRGTHRGELKGYMVSWLTEPLMPSGRRIEIDGMWIFKVLEGKTLRMETFGVADWLGMLRQLGALITP